MELDLRQVDVIQFHLRSCSQPGQTGKGRVLFQYSLNGGLHWITELVLALDDFHAAKSVKRSHFMADPSAAFDSFVISLDFQIGKLRGA